MLRGGLVSLQNALDRLKPSEKKAALYILAHPDEALMISVQQLSDRCGVSEATIVRLTKSLQMKGLQELKMRIAGDLSSEPAARSYGEIKPGSSADDIMQSVAANNIRSIQDTLAVLSPEEVVRAADALHAARRIYIFGIGASATVARDFKQKLTRINKWCDTSPDLYTQMTSAVLLEQRDVAFGISYMGETEEVLGAAALAKRQGATVITLTKSGPSRLEKLGDIRLYASSVEQPIRSGATSSRIAQLSVIDMLFTVMASRNPDTIIPLLEKTRNAVSLSEPQA